jgi:hypothetical protein
MRTAAVLLAMGALVTAPAPALARRAPVVLELFTAQGCVSCNKADDLLAKLAGRSDVIAITWPVDYWDYLGWQDTFAQTDFTERQKAYEHPLGLRDVYTPQVIVNGAAEASGDDAAALDTLIAKARHATAPAPQIQFTHSGRIAVGSGRRSRPGADVWLIRFDPNTREVEVKAGDNRGARVSETNVVREAVRLGRWDGKPVLFKAPLASQDGLRELVIVQEPHGGRIIGAREKTPAP